jgi:hypothetical protein
MSGRSRVFPRAILELFTIRRTFFNVRLSIEIGFRPIGWN